MWAPFFSLLKPRGPPEMIWGRGKGTGPEEEILGKGREYDERERAKKLLLKRKFTSWVLWACHAFLCIYIEVQLVYTLYSLYEFQLFSIVTQHFYTLQWERPTNSNNCLSLCKHITILLTKLCFPFSPIATRTPRWQPSFCSLFLWVCFCLVCLPCVSRFHMQVQNHDY